MRRALVQSALVAALLVVPAALVAQIAPDTPRLISPHGSGGLAVFYLDPGTLPGDDEALLGTWAMPGLPKGVRLRGGVGRGPGAVDAVFGGIDVQAPLLRGKAAMPFDLDWQTGVGMSVGDYTLVTLPLGLSGGFSFTSGSVWIAPYLTAGLAADFRLGDDAPEKSFEVSPSLDIGLDLAFDRNRKIVFRSAASLGDRQAVAFGLALGLGRPPTVQR